MTVSLIDHPIFGSGAPADPHAWIFHYTSLPNAVAIARSGTLKFNSLAEMNDPREYKELKVPVLNLGLKATPSQTRRTEAKLNWQRHTIRAASFTRDEGRGRPNTIPRTDGRGYARPMMWTHYGNRHLGMCFVFNRQAFESAVTAKFASDVSFGPVEYVTGPDRNSWTPLMDTSDIHALGVDVAADKLLASYEHELLFQKNKEWDVEREWRCCVHRQPPKAVVDVALVHTIVAGVVVGMSVPQDKLAMVKEVVTAFSVLTNVAVAYQHQVNVIDTLPIDTTGPNWRYFTDNELSSLGHTSH